MKSGLSKRGLAALIIYFVMITAVCAPIAFNVGKARGADAASTDAPPSLSETGGQPDSASLIRAGHTGAECDGDPAIRQVACHAQSPGGASSARGGGKSGSSNKTEATSRQGGARAGPLQIATARSIAGDRLSSAPSQNAPFGGASSGDDLFVPASPLSLALAPDLAGASGNTVSGATAPASRPPRAIIPNAQALPGGPADGGPIGEDDPSVVVTPAPAALPLLLTGLFGFFLAARAGKR
ncbi:MAG: hypothetical protein AAFW68_05680 [Pseudomonadota bacterium]